MEVFQKIGADLDRLWRDYHYDEVQFPALAARVLADAHPHDRCEYLDILEWVRTTRTLPRQVNINSHFGEPPLTVFAAPNFYIEVLFWLDGTTTIHQHVFSGAFQVLSGSSVHTEFGFRGDHRVNARMQIGTVKYLRSEVLSRGDTRTIVAGQGFIHSLFHLERPSVTVVIRTYQDPDQFPQMHYARPFFAIDSFYKEESLSRRMQCLEVLRRTDTSRYEAAFADSLVKADPHAAFVMAHQALEQAVKPQSIARVMEVVRSSQSEHADEFRQVLEEAGRQAEIIRLRRQLTNPDQRFFLALVLNVPSREGIVDSVRRRFSSDPLEMILKWVTEISRGDSKVRSGLNPIGTSFNDATPLVLNGLLRGYSMTRLKESLAEQYDDVEDQTDDIVALCRELSRSLLLRPLMPKGDDL